MPTDIGFVFGNKRSMNMLSKLSERERERRERERERGRERERKRETEMLYAFRTMLYPSIMSNLVSVIPITAALEHLPMLRNSSILGRGLLMLRCIR